MEEKRTVRRKSTSTNESQTSSTNTGSILMWGVVGVGAAVLIILLILSLQDPKPIEGLISLGRPERGHDDSVAYSDPTLPPAGGIHANQWQQCGIYDIPIESKYAVHSLEHGAVWITYQPELSADAVIRLKTEARRDSFVLMSPFPGQRSPIVLSAWGYQLELESASDKRIRTFIERYTQGPQTPEPGASCGGNNSIGQPTG